MLATACGGDSGDGSCESVADDAIEVVQDVIDEMDSLSLEEIAGMSAENARNYTQCDSLLLGKDCGAHTVPYIEVKNNSSRVEHEATTSKVDDDQLFYCRQRGLSEEDAVSLIVNGFAREVIQKLPMEFMAETQRLIGISLEGSVG